MEIKRGKASSKIKCNITTLLVLNICIILVLVPIYRRVLLTAKTSHHDNDEAHTPQEVAVVHQPKSELIGQSIRGRSPPLQPHADVAIPYIGEDQFNLKYSTKYKGLLPTKNGEFPDLSCGRRPDFFRFFQLPKSERSRFHEDKIIYDLFKNTTIPSSTTEETLLPRGTYVELGAFDGKEESNTIFFDKCLGWKGLLIEAQSHSYQKVIENRPHAVKMSFSPTCKNEGETAKFYDYPLSNNGMEGLAKSYTGKETIDVPCGPLTPVLHDIFGPDGKVTFFSLDVEGAELMVLETLDFNTLSIEVIMVEIQNTHCPEANCPNVLNIRRHMAMTGKYALFVNFLEASDVYIRHGTPTWMRARAIEKNRKETLARAIHEQMMKEQQQLIG